MKSIWRHEAGIIESLPMRVEMKRQQVKAALRPTTISKAIKRPIYMSRVRRISPDLVAHEEYVITREKKTSRPLILIRPN